MSGPFFPDSPFFRSVSTATVAVNLNSRKKSRRGADLERHWPWGQRLLACVSLVRGRGEAVDHDLRLLPRVGVRGVEVWELSSHGGGEGEDQSDCEDDLFQGFLLSVFAG